MYRSVNILSPIRSTSVYGLSLRKIALCNLSELEETSEIETGPIVEESERALCFSALPCAVKLSFATSTMVIFQ